MRIQFQGFSELCSAAYIDYLPIAVLSARCRLHVTAAHHPSPPLRKLYQVDY